MRAKLAVLILVGSLLISSSAFSTPGILKRFAASYRSVENSQLNSCRTCHMPVLQRCLNNYGLVLRERNLDFAAVESLDSDNDGKTNIEEIRMLELPGSQAGADELFLFTNRMGSISFNHEKHSLDKTYLAKGKCDNCHSGEMFPRHFDDTVSWQKIAHDVCKGCHEKSGNTNAPLRCKQCHVKEKKEK